MLPRRTRPAPSTSEVIAEKARKGVELTKTMERASRYEPDKMPPSKPREAKGKARTSKALKPGDVRDWDLIYPRLKKLFGDDCLEFPEGHIRPNPSDQSAGKLVDLFHDGTFGSGWRWMPAPGDPVRFLRCYEAFLTLHGYKAGGEAYGLLRSLAARCRAKAAAHIESRDIEKAMAGYLYKLILSKASQKPYLAPTFTKWDMLWTFVNFTSMLASYSSGVDRGEVPSNPIEFIDKVVGKYWGQPGGLCEISPEAAKQLLTSKSTGPTADELLQKRLAPI